MLGWGVLGFFGVVTGVVLGCFMAQVLACRRRLCRTALLIAERWMPTLRKIVYIFFIVGDFWFLQFCKRIVEEFIDLT